MNTILSAMTTDWAPALKKAAQADWGPAIEKAARIIRVIVAVLITLALLTAECAYDLGRQLRLAIEARNEQLAVLWLAVLGIEAQTQAQAAPAPAPALVATAAPVSPVASTGRRAARSRARRIAAA